jgi:hypothetical protein
MPGLRPGLYGREPGWPIGGLPAPALKPKGYAPARFRSDGPDAARAPAALPPNLAGEEGSLT